MNMMAILCLCFHWFYQLCIFCFIIIIFILSLEFFTIVDKVVINGQNLCQLGFVFMVLTHNMLLFYF